MDATNQVSVKFKNIINFHIECECVPGVAYTNSHTSGCQHHTRIQLKEPIIIESGPTLEYIGYIKGSSLYRLYKHFVPDSVPEHFLKYETTEQEDYLCDMMTNIDIY